MADHSDGLLLMNYDQHQGGSGPGPIAARGLVPRQPEGRAEGCAQAKDDLLPGQLWIRLDYVAAGGGEGLCRYFVPKVLGAEEMSTQDAWQAADDAEAQIQLDPDSLNVHFAYDDDDPHVRHQIWFLDAVTLLNEMRAARALGIETFALWRLGSEDNSLWKIWDPPIHANPVLDLAQVEPGFDVDTEGEGDILHIKRKMQSGRRAVTLDDDDSVPLPFRSVTAESMTSYPLSYTIQQTGYHPNQVALSFDDGPDPKWTRSSSTS